MMRGCLALAALIMTSCYNPKIDEERYICNESRDCPNDFKCSVCKTCISTTRADNDCTLPCANGSKLRVPGDPLLPGVAFCQAAWAIPGLDTSPQCGRQPPTSGNNCSVADNCVAGWHVCGETELATRGLTQTLCGTSFNGFFIARARGSVSSNAGVCGDATNPSLDQVVFGCGNRGNAATCDTLARSLYTLNCDTTQSWVCGTNPYDDIVRGNANLLGGVICCRDAL